MRLLRLLGALSTASILLLLWSGSPAAAHAQLIGSTPAADEVLDTAPSEVELEFNEELIETGSTLLVIDSEGENRAAGDVVLDGRFVRAEVASDLPDGSYEIRWRVVSADGHPINGRIPFSVGAPGDPVPDESSDGDGDDDEGSMTMPIVLVAGGVVVIVLVGWLVLGGRRR